MAVLTLEQLRAKRANTKEVDLSQFGWDGSVVIGKLSMRKRDEWVRVAEQKNNINTACTLLQLGIVQPSIGPEEAQELADFDADMTDHIVAEILSFNGMNKEGSKELERGFHAGRGPEVPVPAGDEAANVSAPAGA